MTWNISEQRAERKIKTMRTLIPSCFYLSFPGLLLLSELDPFNNSYQLADLLFNSDSGFDWCWTDPYPIANSSFPLSGLVSTSVHVHLSIYISEKEQKLNEELDVELFHTSIFPWQSFFLFRNRTKR